VDWNGSLPMAAISSPSVSPHLKLSDILRRGNFLSAETHHVVPQIQQSRLPPTSPLETLSTPQTRRPGRKSMLQRAPSKTPCSPSPRRTNPPSIPQSPQITILLASPSFKVVTKSRRTSPLSNSQHFTISS
jgi:hypothetical protein